MQEYNYIYEIYKQKSFSKAAKSLYVSQPALSATTKKIEERLGVQLFERTTTSISLTEAGKAYIETAEKIMSLEEDLISQLNDINNLSTGKLTLAGTAFFSSYIIPPIVKEYSKKYPGIKLDFIESDSSSFYKNYAENNIDLIIDGGTYNNDNFEHINLYNENILLAVPNSEIKTTQLKNSAFSMDDIIQRKHILNDSQAISIREFINHPFLLLKEEHDLYQRALKICNDADFVPCSSIKLNQLMTSFNLTCQQMGVSFVTDSLITTCHKNVDVSYFKLKVSDKSLITRPVFVAFWKSKHLSRAMQCFIDIAKNIYLKWN